MRVEGETAMKEVVAKMKPESREVEEVRFFCFLTLLTASLAIVVASLHRALFLPMQEE
jgi:hypothetical protein